MKENLVLLPIKPTFFKPGTYPPPSLLSIDEKSPKNFIFFLKLTCIWWSLGSCHSKDWPTTEQASSCESFNALKNSYLRFALRCFYTIFFWRHHKIKDGQHCIISALLYKVTLSWKKKLWICTYMALIIWKARIDFLGNLLSIICFKMILNKFFSWFL